MKPWELKTQQAQALMEDEKTFAQGQALMAEAEAEMRVVGDGEEPPSEDPDDGAYEVEFEITATGSEYLSGAAPTAE